MENDLRNILSSIDNLKNLVNQKHSEIISGLNPEKLTDQEKEDLDAAVKKMNDAKIEMESAFKKFNF